LLQHNSILMALEIGPLTAMAPAEHLESRGGDPAWSVPVPSREVRRVSSRALRTGFGASIAAHVAVLAMMLWSSAAHHVGGGGTDIEAVGVELVTATALDAIFAVGTAVPSAAMAAVVEQQSGAPEAVQAATPEATPQPQDPPPRETVLTTSDAAAPVLISEKAEVKQEAHPLAPEQKPDTIARVTDEAVDRGGALATGLGTATLPSATVAASSGVIEKFAQEIRTALSKNRPRGRGARGTVSVLFSITAAGDVGAVSVSKSSGDTTLDAIAVSTISRTLFPKPPPGMAEAQLTYVVPFHFR
jgi:TonB family protein